MEKLIAEKAKRNNKHIYNCFVDFLKAFDSIRHDVTWATLKSNGVGNRVRILRNIGERSKSTGKVGRENRRVVLDYNRGKTRRPNIT